MEETLAIPVRPFFRRHGALVGLVLFFVVLSIPYGFKAAQSGNRSAILRWRSQLEQIDEVNIYERYAYPNPPMMALLLSWSTEVPPLAASLGWFYAKVLMTLLSLHWTFCIIEAGGRFFPPWAKLLTILLSLRPIMGDLSHGNINLFILFLVVGAVYCWQRGYEASSGLILALAVACKVTPALFVPYFLWKRAWKTLAGCTLGLVLFLLVVPGLRYGMQHNLELLQSWREQMVKPFVVAGIVTPEHNNQSLPGLVFRMTTHSPSFSTYVNDKYTPVSYHNLLTLEPSSATWIVKGFMGIFTAIVIWTCRTPTSPRQNWRLAAEFSLVVLGMLLFSERTWKHHCVTLLLPFAVLCYYLACCKPGPRLKAYLIATLASVALLIESTSTALLEDHLAKMAQTYGAYVWAYMLLVAALAVVLRKSNSTSFNYDAQSLTSDR